MKTRAAKPGTPLTELEEETIGARMRQWSQANKAEAANCGASIAKRMIFACLHKCVYWSPMKETTFWRVGPAMPHTACNTGPS